MSDISLGNVHHYILSTIVDKQHSPDVADIATHFQIPEEKAAILLNELADYHGVVLHPNSSKIWVIHPFSLSPTGFTVSTPEKTWWGTCAWCSFGMVHLIDEDTVIETRLGATSESVKLQVKDKKLVDADYVVHFPVKMANAWDNVIYTCSVMLLFRDEQQVDDWCQKYNIPKGDVQSASKVFEFAGEWYGNHLAEDWVKWTSKEAKDIFDKYGLTSDIWKIEVSHERF